MKPDFTHFSGAARREYGSSVLMTRIKLSVFKSFALVRFCFRYFCVMNVSAFGKFLFTLCFSSAVLCLQAQQGVAQVWTLDTIRMLPKQVTAATTDALNQVIVALPDGRIQRYDSLLYTLQVEYSNPRFGAVALLDASNPLHILAYYPDYLHIKLFNRNLILNASINLLEFGYSQVPLVCTARDGNLWLYNALDFQFEKIDVYGKKLRTSIRTNTLTEAIPIAMYDTGDRFISVFSDGVVYLFDAFGQNTGRIQIPAQSDYRLTDAQVLALRTGELTQVSFLSEVHGTRHAQVKGLTSEMRFAGTNLFYLSKNANTDFYKLKPVE